MVQRRVYDFGSLLTQERTKTLASSLFTPGIYGGFDPVIVSGTQLQFTPGTYLLPNGVLVNEDANIDITVPTPATAQDYTVIVNHDDIQATGGSPALYSLVTGIKARSGDPNTNSLALLWIRHTGGGPLTSDMLSRPPVLRAGSLPAEDGFVPAPFSNANDEVRGANILTTQQSRSVRAGVNASLSASGATVVGQIDVTLPLGTVMEASDVGRYLLLSGGAGPNNGWFEITAFVSTTEVRITDNGTAPGSEASLTWDVREPEQLGLQIKNTAVTGLQTYQFRLPLPSRPLPQSIELYGALASLATVSISAAPYDTHLADRTVLVSTPATLTGPLEGLDPRSSPAGTFDLDNYDESNPPTSLGVTVTVPAQSSGVFIRGFNLVTD